jgi:hypothetical protein
LLVALDFRRCAAKQAGAFELVVQLALKGASIDSGGRTASRDSIHAINSCLTVVKAAVAPRAFMLKVWLDRMGNNWLRIKVKALSSAERKPVKLMNKKTTRRDIDPILILLTILPSQMTSLALLF